MKVKNSLAKLNMVLALSKSLLSLANRIQLSQSTSTLIKDHPEFILEPRGPINVKGKGKMETFWLQSAFPIPDPTQPTFQQSTTLIRLSSTVSRLSLKKHKSMDPFPEPICLEIEEPRL